jgi:NAD(P)-dependent dehydrogenase (short-subunit alcohol dehydrogenase family)
LLEKEFNMYNTEKVYLITGGTSGVGYAIARGLARTGGEVIITSRSHDSGDRAVKALSAYSDNAKVSYLVADLALQKDIIQLAKTFKEDHQRLDALINVAGAIYFDQQFTSEGIDRSLAINYLAHFSLTARLLDLLNATPQSRVLTVGGAPRFIKKPQITLKDLRPSKSYNGLTALSKAMFARVYFAFELAERLKGTNTSSFIFHPGLITSNLVNDAPLWLRFITYLMKPWEKKDCKIGVYLATSDEISAHSGSFYDDEKNVISLNDVYHSDMGRALWSETETFLHHTF